MSIAALNDIAMSHLGRAAGDVRAPCPNCAKSARDTALSVTVKVDGSVVVHCHRCGESGAAREPNRVNGHKRPAQRARPKASAPEDHAALWDSGVEPGQSFEHEYLARKQIGAHGIRAKDDLLLVPMRNAAGELVGLQKITANGTKLYSKGARKTGAFHVIGTPNTRLIITEGYATAATINAVTSDAVACAFDCGNLIHVAKALRAKFPDLALVVAGDDDHATTGNPGEVAARAAAKAVGGSVVMPSWPEGIARGDGTDFNDLRIAAGDETVRRAFEHDDSRHPPVGDDHHRRDDHHHQGDGGEQGDRGGESAASPAGSPRPPPLDLLKPMAAPPLRAVDVPDVLACFAESQARATGFDVSILLAAGIGAACAALSDDVRLCVASGWFESARLWIAIVGGPGSGKSPGSKAAMAPVFAMHREGIAQWARETEGVADKKKPPMPQLYTSDATTEALAETLRGNSRGLLYFVDEFESWLASHDAYRQGAGKDRGEWLRLFDGGPHQVNRIIRGTPFVTNWGCSLLSATTPAALRKLAPKLPDDGLLQRFLLVLAGPMELPDGAVLRVETRQPSEAWDSALRRLYAFPAAVVRLSSDAREVFNHEQADLHRLTGAFEESHPSFAAHTAKRAQMLARLALVFHALSTDNVTDDLSATTMSKAARFLRRQERHAQAVYGSMLGANTGMSLAKDVARSILASSLDSFNRRELTPRCKAFRHADEPTRQAALQLLGDFGWISSKGPIFSHGAQWTVDPRVHQLFAEHGEVARQRRETIRQRITAGDNE